MTLQGKGDPQPEEFPKTPAASTGDTRVGENDCNMLVRVTSIFLTLVGLLWTAIVAWFFLMMGGLEVLHFGYLGKAALYYAWMFVGPVLLLVGPLLYARARFRTAASVLLGSDA